MYLMNVYSVFKVHGRLIAFSLSLCRIFFRFSRPFSKIFSALQKAKKRSSHLSVRRNERKK